MSGFENDVVVGKNLNFDNDSNPPHYGILDAAGKLPIGTGNSAPSPEILGGSLTSPLGTLSIGYSSPDITIDLAGGSTGIDSISVDAGTSPVFPDGNGLVTISASTVSAGTTPIQTSGSAATVTIEAQISQSIASADSTKIGLSNFDSAYFSVDNDGFVSTSGTGLGETITGDSGGALSPTAGNWNVQGGSLSSGTNASTTSGSGSTLTITSINCAKWIVDPTANRGTHQTVQGAINAASSGETVFIRPGTYTENLTLKAGVNLCAFDGDQFGTQVVISGNATFTGSGTVAMSGLTLQTNGSFVLTVSGGSASVLYLDNCFISAANTAISYTSNNSSSSIELRNCLGDLTTTGIAYFALSGAGTFGLRDCNFKNSGLSTTASTISTGNLYIDNCGFANSITSNGTSGFAITYSNIDLTAVNTTCLTAGGSGNQACRYTRVASGTASAISIGSTMISTMCQVDSTNTNAVTGAGTLLNAGIAFSNTSYKINTTTQTARNLDLGGVSFDGGSNVLANYSSSTWTPVLTFGGGSTGITYSTQQGAYTRIGNVVFFSCHLVLTSKGTSTGVALITGLPLTSSASNYCNINSGTSGAFTLSATFTNISGAIGNSSSSIALEASSNSAGSNPIQVTNAMFANTSQISFAGFYFV